MKFSKVIVCLSLLLLATGCATNRSVVELEAAEKVENPTNGIDVKIASVEDARDFQFRPRTPDIPSISEDEVDNPQIKQRAIGRKRNGFGKALGDVLLPEGTTVASFMAESMSNSFRKAGYRVIEENDPAYADAVPVKVQINEFWSWIEMGFWQLKLHNRAKVTLTAPIDELQKGITVTNQHTGSHAAIFESDWQASAVSGRNEITEKVADALK
ncbi:hypothetical protein GUA87_15270 [Sneathiella sp. P13V-1]|uniref:hypothetical protein n=1 Tax=Sneathiella sp. P13V-1 TaxID=2697366 RepID=UPI00187B588E|nr:hypothetical protein [Sneathiella sp. P13V-1]MBE7638218.1 hypothetical protein [Sneathiella sp. P13V-1]